LTVVRTGGGNGEGAGDTHAVTAIAEINKRTRRIKAVFIDITNYDIDLDDNSLKKILIYLE
jgi:hypothetical protein